MKRALWRTLLVLCLTGALTSAARATPGWSGSANMLPGSGVSIEYVSMLSQVPPNGYLPVQITINNRSGSPRTYSFRLTTGDGFHSSGSRQMTVFQSVNAENDAETRTLALLPVAPSERGTQYYRPTSIQATGYGAEASQAGITSPYLRGTQRTVFVGMAEHLYTHSWGPLEAAISRGSRSLCGTRVDLDLLPPDWRALSGLQCLWLTPSDYESLDAGQKTAVQDWISLGGVLYLCEATPDAATQTEFGRGDPRDHDSVTRGFGEVRWFTCDPAKELPAERVSSEIFSLDRFENGLYQEADSWSMAGAVGKLRLNVPFLLGFIGLFAILVGPVNLFYFARADRRHRLFWTTPAISLGASLLLIVIIVLQDGFGGNGARVSFTYLLPAQNKAVTVQEQLSRTGVLFARDFTTDDHVLLSPVALRNANSQGLLQTGNGYGGDWFVSRSLQAQRLETVQPTRARVQILNGDPTRSGAPPVVVSSLPLELEDFYYMDEAGTCWRGKNVRTGEQQTLRPQTDFPKLSNDVIGGSPYLTALFRHSTPRGDDSKRLKATAFFLALAHRGPFIDTLRSIRWTSEQAIYVGPVTTDR